MGWTFESSLLKLLPGCLAGHECVSVCLSTPFSVEAPQREKDEGPQSLYKSPHPQFSPGPQEGLNHPPPVNQKPALQLPQLVNKPPGEGEGG